MINDEKVYVRMTLNERIQHSLLASSFIVLVITGFMLKFPEAFWVKWISFVLGEGAFEARGVIHRIASGVMVGVSLYHMYYVIFTVRGRKLVKDLWVRRQDLLDMLRQLGYLAGRNKEKVLFGRFSYIEKMEYWAVVWGTVVMGFTGGVLWFENIFLQIIDNSGMYIATVIHYYEAILASLAILVWHFYFVFLNPDTFPMSKAWFKGVLTREEMEKEHPLELEEIEKSELKNDENGAPITVTEAKIAGINKEINVSKNDGRKDE
jgi:cytochrome b subunit of formate dehydrogenase